MTFKYTFDERIEDGLYCAQALEEMRQFLEDPQGLIKDSQERLDAESSKGASGET